MLKLLTFFGIIITIWPFNYTSSCPCFPPLKRSFNQFDFSFDQISCVNLIKLSLIGLLCCIWLLLHVISMVRCCNTSLNLLCKHKWPNKSFNVSSKIVLSCLICLDLSDTIPFLVSLCILRILCLISNQLIALIVFLLIQSVLMIYKVLHLLSNILFAVVVNNFILMVNKFILLGKVLKNFINLFKSNAIWIPFLLIIMSNDVEFNPGDHIVNRNFTFCNWNINSLAKDNFSRLNLIQADNSIHNYDIISLCETSLNNDVVLPDSLLHSLIQ